MQPNSRSILDEKTFWARICQKKNGRKPTGRKVRPFGGLAPPLSLGRWVQPCGQGGSGKRTAPPQPKAALLNPGWDHRGHQTMDHGSPETPKREWQYALHKNKQRTILTAGGKEWENGMIPANPSLELKGTSSSSWLWSHIWRHMGSLHFQQLQYTSCWGSPLMLLWHL